jgi:hypothetical protein
VAYLDFLLLVVIPVVSLNTHGVHFPLIFQNGCSPANHRTARSPDSGSNPLAPTISLEINNLQACEEAWSAWS